MSNQDMAENFLVGRNKFEHTQFVLNTLNEFFSQDMDIILLCEDGQSVSTNGRFLGIFSSLIRDVCNEGKDSVYTISVPFSKTEVDLTIKYLSFGEVKASEKTLKNILDFLTQLNIETQNVKNEPLKKPRKLQLKNDAAVV